MGSTRRKRRECGGEFCEFWWVCLEERMVVVAVSEASGMLLYIIDC